MQYDVNNGLLQVVIEGEEINAVVGEAAQIDVGEAINYIQSGKAEIEEAVEEGISDFNENAIEKTNEFNLNAQNKTSDFNSNANQKTLDFNSNASDKTSEFNLNAQDKTSDFNANAVEKTNDFNSNAQDKTGDFNDNAVDKTNDFNDNASAKQALVDAGAQTATDKAAEAKQWAIGDPTEPTGGSAKHWAKYAESIAEGIGDPANRDLSNLTETGNNRFVNLQQQIDAIVASSDVFDIVATYAELQAYDISTVPVNDIVKVLVDSTHSGAATYYRCIETAGVKSWSYIGSEGAYYTKGEADVLLAGRANTDLSNLSVTGQAVLNAKQDIATAVNYDNISNCITEIPQDIKLELDNGTLTLKAGSKVYIPNGTGVFNTITISADKSWGQTTYAGGKLMVFYRNQYNDLFSMNDSECYSGSTAPTAHTNMVWYDTANNKIKWTSNGGSTWNDEGLSLPITNSSYANGTGFTSIDQVFNGFGYIGSTVFALPGVKGIIPNGRNADGTLKNNEYIVNNVLTHTWGAGLWGNAFPITLGQYGLGYLGNTNTFIGGERPSNPSPYTRWYSEEENCWYEYVNDWHRILFYICGDINLSNGKVISLITKTVFHAVDYNDFNNLTINVLKAVYPVGSCYIGVGAVCPLEAFFGTWTLQSSGIVTSVNTNVPVKGNGIALGLTNGTNNGVISSSYIYTNLYHSDAFGVNVGATANHSVWTPDLKAVGVTTDASKSGIVGTVTRSTLSVNIWQRTA